MKVLDLFSGAGGFSSGFALRYSDTHLAVDIDSFALATYALNYPLANTLQCDIGTTHSNGILSELGGEPDIIIASPPCEEFSRANPDSDTPAAERIYGTGTARLLLDTIRLIGDLMPKVFVVENVAALLHRGGGVIVRQEFERLGIDNIQFNMVRAHQHGNPSKRLRVFISNLKLNLPRGIPPRVMEAIGNPPPLGVDALFSPGEHVANHDLHPLTEDKMKRVRKTRWRHGVKHFRALKRRTMPNWVRLSPDQVSTSIIGLSRYIHPFEDRLLTVREHARLMSYPDSFVFIGPTDNQYNQVGESVPPLISHLIAEEVQKHLG
ncbi:MAG: DNA cytosine methyltransferase [Candidatus Thorarchaeota archaeon]|nr:MAG: DNA cytosine methyltransferase [Candidatus Thorarchaeota archaeon]